MDSELTSIASVKALNQGVATTDSPTFAGVTANGTVEFDGLSGTGAVTVTDILDQDDMSGNSATALATQQSIKAYVDSQVGTVDTLAEVLANGNATGGTDIAFGDNDKALFGAGSDLQIYHSGSHSFITDAGTGDLYIGASNNIALMNAAFSENKLLATTDGALKLYYDGSEKLATTSTGIDVTGTVTVSDGSTSAPSITNAGDSNSGIYFPADDNIGLVVGGSRKLLANSSGVSINNGVLDADGGITVDNITIDGQEIDVSSGDLTLDVAGDIILDTGGDDIKFKVGGTDFGSIAYSNSNLLLTSAVSNGDILLKGNDGGSTITALTLDMSNGGRADFNNDIGLNDGRVLRLGNGDDTSIYNDGSHFNIVNTTSNQDMLFKGNDDGVNITALTLDMSNAGAATFNSTVTSTGLTVSSTGATTATIEAGGGGDAVLDIKAAEASGGESIIRFSDSVSGVGFITYAQNDGGSDYMRFGTASAERMRIDASGTLNLGTTENVFGGADRYGYNFYANGQFNQSIDGTGGAVAQYINRENADGAFTEFYKDRVKVGSIGTTGGDIYVGTGDTTIRFSDGGDQIRPATATGANRDAAVDLGKSDARFKDLYLSGSANAGTVKAQTSGGYFLTESTTNAFSITSNGANGYLAITDEFNSSERLRIDQSGNLLFNTTSNYSSSKMTFEYNSASNFGITVRDSGSATTAGHFNFIKGGSVVGTIQSTSSATAYNTSSDQRLKDNIVDAPSASDDIDAIQVRSFDWKVDGSHQKYGMVAQELNTVAPEAVSTPEDSEEMMGVDYSKLVPMLVKEIQSLRARVAQLETN
jgi:hypothetical protein